MNDEERLKALREACSAAHRMQSYIEAEIAVAEARLSDPVARAERAEAEVARVKAAVVEGVKALYCSRQATYLCHDVSCGNCIAIRSLLAAVGAGEDVLG